MVDMGILSGLLKSNFITEERIRDFIADTETKRICFSRIQKCALWKTGKGEDMITVPFEDSVGPLLEEYAGIVLRKSSKGKYYKQLSKEEYDKVKSFVELHSEVVFLRDLLDVSVALSLNFEDGVEEHTIIGKLEKNAKYDNDEKALVLLAEVVDKFIISSTMYANADYIIAIPPTKEGTDNLPTKVIKKLTNFTGKDVSGCARWTSKTVSLKNADGADKLEMISHSGFELDENLNLQGKSVVLVDDLYMSGITLQYVAMKLKEAGAGKVYGLCFVKSFSNR